MSSNMIQPAELADYIKKYCPIEYVASFGYAYLSFEASGYWWVNILAMPLFLYNCTRFAAKDHKQYFITKGEYKKNFPRMELQYQIKSVFYAFLFAIALVLTIFKAIDFFGLLSLWLKLSSFTLKDFQTHSRSRLLDNPYSFTFYFWTGLDSVHVREKRAFCDLSLVDWFWMEPTRTRLTVCSSGCVADRLLFVELLLGYLELDFLEVGLFFLADFFFYFAVFFMGLI